MPKRHKAHVGFVVPRMRLSIPKIQDALVPFRDKQEPKSTSEDLKQELNAVQKAFAASAKRETAINQMNIEGAFYAVLIFQTAEQVDCFFEKAGVELDDDLFCNGINLAKQLGFVLPAASKFSKTKGQSPRIAAIPKLPPERR